MASHIYAGIPSSNRVNSPEISPQKHDTIPVPNCGALSRLAIALNPITLLIHPLADCFNQGGLQ